MGTTNSLERLCGRSFGTLSELHPGEFQSLLELAEQVKQHPDEFRDRLKNKTHALIFEKHSTRTRVSFEVGIQELGDIKQNISKNKKLDLMHIGVCKLLSDYGYYVFDYVDNDGWPHYKLIEKLPNLKPGEQTILMKEAIVNYFLKINYIN